MIKDGRHQVIIMKVITMRANIKRLDLLACFHYILNPLVFGFVFGLFVFCLFFWGCCCFFFVCFFFFGGGGLILYVPVNSYGHVGMVSSPNHTIFMGKLDEAVIYNQYFVHILALVTDNKCIQVVSLRPSYNSVVAI